MNFNTVKFEDKDQLLKIRREIFSILQEDYNLAKISRWVDSLINEAYSAGFEDGFSYTEGGKVF